MKTYTTKFACAFCAALLFIFTPLSPCKAANAYPNVIPWFYKPPICDGNLDEGEYDHAWKKQLLRMDGTAVEAKTEVMVGYNRERIFIAFRCQEPHPEQMVRNWRTSEERDNNIWHDDCVEAIFEVRNSNRKPYLFHIILNSNNISYDSYGNDMGWNPVMTTHVQMNKNEWIAEIAIPFGEFSVSAPRPGDRWLINFCRERPNAKEYSMLQPRTKGGFRDIGNFGLFEFGNAPGRDTSVQLWSSSSAPEVGVHLASKADIPLKAFVAVYNWRNIQVGNTVEAELPAGQTIAIPLKSANEPGIDVVVKDTDGNIVREYRRRFPAITRKNGAISLGDKALYSELFAQPTRTRPQIGHIFWSHGMLNMAANRLWGVQFGEPLEPEPYYEILGKYKLLPIGSVDSFKRNNMWELAQKNNVKLILFADYRPSGTKIPHFAIDPDSLKRSMNILNRELGNPETRDAYTIVFFGDEINDRFARIIVDEMPHRNEKGYEFLNEVAKEVLERYGFGKFCVPESQTDPNPFRWIAYHTYLHDKLMEHMKLLRNEAKRLKPDVLMLSDDPTASFDRIYDYGEFTQEHCDIITHQTYPRNNLSDFGFFPKYITDLSRVPEIWPCMHVEEYGRSYTPEEVRIKLSEAVRNGATAFHYYLSDTVGRRSATKYMITEFFGAPDRAQIEMAAADALLNMPPLKFPEPDIAIYTPIETQRSYYGNIRLDRPWVLHTRLERNAKTAFVHVNAAAWSKADRSGLKAIFLADAKYVSPKTISQLSEYVKAGGTLVALDPEAFSFTADGNVPEEARKLFFGGTTLHKLDTPFTYLTCNGLKTALSSGPQYALRPGDDCQPSGYYLDNDGKETATVASITHPLGKGKVILFGANPSEPGTVSSQITGQFFRDFVASVGGKLDYDIWRFEFPASLIVPPPMPKGRCLTGNSIVWRQFKADTSLNAANSLATYTLSVAADMGDPANTPISLDNGRLTNRRKAETAPSLVLDKGKVTDWMDEFNQPEPFSIRFDLAETSQLDRVRLIYTGTMRSLTLRYATEGGAPENIRFEARTEAGREDFVREWVLPFPANASARMVELLFDKAPEGSNPYLGLAEVEIWDRE